MTQNTIITIIMARRIWSDRTISMSNIYHKVVSDWLGSSSSKPLTSAAAIVGMAPTTVTTTSKYDGVVLSLIGETHQLALLVKQE